MLNKNKSWVFWKFWWSNTCLPNNIMIKQTWKRQKKNYSRKLDLHAVPPSPRTVYHIDRIPKTQMNHIANPIRRMTKNSNQKQTIRRSRGRGRSHKRLVLSEDWPSILWFNHSSRHYIISFSASVGGGDPLNCCLMSADCGLRSVEFMEKSIAGVTW